jgi:hypothetical protein
MILLCKSTQQVTMVIILERRADQHGVDSDHGADIAGLPRWARASEPAYHLTLYQTHLDESSAKSVLGQKRRPLQQTAAGRCPLCPP